MVIEDYKWYVVHTYSGYEDKVAENIKKVVENRGLHDQIVKVCVPKEIEEEKKGDKTKKKERKIFPGYVLVKLAISYNEKAGENRMTDEVWYIIRNTRGVTGFVGPDSRPIALTEQEIENLGLENYADKHSVSVNYKIGDLVTIIYGSFEGYSGIVDKIDLEKERVRVLLPMMGSDTPFDLSLDQVQSAVD